MLEGQVVCASPTFPRKVRNAATPETCSGACFLELGRRNRKVHFHLTISPQEMGLPFERNREVKPTIVLRVLIIMCMDCCCIYSGD